MLSNDPWIQKTLNEACTDLNAILEQDGILFETDAVEYIRMKLLCESPYDMQMEFPSILGD